METFAIAVRESARLKRRLAELQSRLPAQIRASAALIRLIAELNATLLRLEQLAWNSQAVPSAPSSDVPSSAYLLTESIRSTLRVVSSPLLGVLPESESPSARPDASADFVQAYNSSMTTFDENWATATKLLTSPSVQNQSFFGDLPSEDRTTLLDFLQLVLNQRDELSKLFVALEGPALTSIVAPAAEHNLLSCPLAVILRVVVSACGSEVLARFVADLVANAIVQTTGPYHVNSHRAKELDEFVISVIDIAHAFGVRPTAQPGDGSSSSSTVGAGPLTFGRAVEQVLLELRLAVRVEREKGRERIIVDASNQRGPQASVATDENIDEDAETSISARWTTPLTSALSSITNAGSQLFVSSVPSESMPEVAPEIDPAVLDALLVPAATDLLQCLSAESGNFRDQPLALVVMGELLCRRFPPNQPKNANARRRAIHLICIRWYGFIHLGKALSRIGTGGCRTAASVPACLDLYTNASPSVGAGTRAKIANALFEDITVDPTDEAIAIFTSLHKTVYSALVEVATQNEDALVTAASRPSHRDLRKAARGCLAAFLHARPAGLREQATAPVRVLTISLQDLCTMYDCCAARLFSSSPIIASLPSTPMLSNGSPSFKRRAAYIVRSLPDEIDSASGPEENDFGARLAMSISALMRLRRQPSSSRDALVHVAVLYAHPTAGRDVTLSTSLSLSGPDSLGDSKPDISSDGASVVSEERRARSPRGWMQLRSESAPIKSKESLTKAQALFWHRILLRLADSADELSESTEDLETRLTHCAAHAAACCDFVTESIYRQAASTLAALSKSHPTLAKNQWAQLYSDVTQPIQMKSASYTDSIRQAQVFESQALDAARESSEAARALLSIIDNLRIRQYATAHYGRSIAFQALRQAVDQIWAADRSEQERERGAAFARSYRSQIDIHDFVRAQDERLHETLARIDETVTQNVMLSTLTVNPFFKREAALLGFDISATSIPILRDSPTSPNTRTIAAFGATHVSLVKPEDLSRDSSEASNAYLLRLSLKVAGYLCSHLLPAAMPTIALGSDAWLQAPYYDTEHSHGRHNTTELPAYTKVAARYILRRLDLNPAPLAKLEAVRDLRALLSTTLPVSTTGKDIGQSAKAKTDTVRRRASLRPHLTDFGSEQATDNTANALSSADLLAPPQVQQMDRGPEPVHTDVLSADELVRSIERAIADVQIRPPERSSIVSSLQTIASLVPSCVLDIKDEGKAFYDVALAMLSIKKERASSLYHAGLEDLAQGDPHSRARDFITVAAREGNESAIALLPSLLAPNKAPGGMTG